VYCVLLLFFLSFFLFFLIYHSDASELIYLPDIRISKSSERQRSINLAISHRGIAALQAIDPSVTDRFLKTIIPVYGRMIHYANGLVSSQAYDLHGQVSRGASPLSFGSRRSVYCFYFIIFAAVFVMAGNQFSRPGTFQRTAIGRGLSVAKCPVLLRTQGTIC
jgi:hypothetical protein